MLLGNEAPKVPKAVPLGLFRTTLFPLAKNLGIGTAILATTLFFSVTFKRMPRKSVSELASMTSVSHGLTWHYKSRGMSQHGEVERAL